MLIKSSGSKLWQFRYYRPLTKQRTKQSFGACCCVPFLRYA
ncbi:hypothetical protein ACNKHK_17090 [Shigella flexneri]